MEPTGREYQPSQAAPRVAHTPINSPACIMVQTAADKYHAAKQALAVIAEEAKAARKELKLAEQQLDAAIQYSKDNARRM